MEKATKLAIGKKENGVDIIENAPREQTSKDNLTYDEAHQNNRTVKMSALRLGGGEDAKSPGDSVSLQDVHRSMWIISVALQIGEENISLLE